MSEERYSQPSCVNSNVLILHPVLQTEPTFIFIDSRLIILLALKINHRRTWFVFTSAEVSADGFQMKRTKWVVQSSAIGRSAGRQETARPETSISLFTPFVFQAYKRVSAFFCRVEIMGWLSSGKCCVRTFLKWKMLSDKIAFSKSVRAQVRLEYTMHYKYDRKCFCSFHSLMT